MFDFNIAARMILRLLFGGLSIWLVIMFLRFMAMTYEASKSMARGAAKTPWEQWVRRQSMTTIAVINISLLAIIMIVIGLLARWLPL